MIKQTRIHYTIFILLVIGAAFGLFLLRFKYKPAQPSMATSPSWFKQDATLQAGSLNIPITIANTDQTRQQGLSDTLSLPVDDGMLFIFDTPNTYGFWMKDMHYPLDMVWMDSAMKIVTITPHVTVDSYPKIFYPSQSVQYVLEVNDGFSTQHDLKVGQQLHLQR